MTDTITGRIVKLDRAQNTRDGNPRYRVTIETPDQSLLSFPTWPDTMWVYEITDEKYSLPGVVFHLTGNQIRYADIPADHQISASATNILGDTETHVFGTRAEAEQWAREVDDPDNGIVSTTVHD